MLARKGTSIIEFLVYLTLFTLMIACCMSWITGTYQLWNSHHIKRANLVNQCTIFDMLWHDLQSAPCGKTWHSFSPHEIIWHSTKDDIGWLFKEGIVYRNQGAYNNQKKAWVRKNGTVVAKTIDNLTFSCSQPENSQTITVTITNAQKASSLTICLKKRPLPWKRKKEDQPSS